MRKVKMFKRFGIYELNQKEKDEYGFSFAVIHPEIMDCYSFCLSPNDADWEACTLQECIDFIRSY